MGFFRISRFVLVAWIVLAWSEAQAAKFSMVTGIPGRSDMQFGAPMVLMEGVIINGDTHRFAEFLKTADFKNASGIVVALNSPGGDVEEAIALAAMLRDIFASVYAIDPMRCVSACFLLFVDAPTRFGEPGALFIHRPYLPEQRARSLNADNSREINSAMYKQMQDWLRERMVPGSLVDRMLVTASTDAYRLTRGDIDSLGIRAAWYEEWLIARCPDTVQIEQAFLQASTKADRERIRPL